MRLSKSALFAGGAVLALFGGCSLESPAKNSGLRILLEDAQSNLSSLLPVAGLAARYQMAAAPPSTISDINCFTVNITGSGIASNSSDLLGCTSGSNFNGTGPGVLSELFQRGGSVTVDVPSGDNRRIDVYGLYPSTSIPDCGGTSGGNHADEYAYYIGGKTVSLKESTTVSVPISYVPRNPDITCTGGSGQNLSFTPDGTAANGRIFYDGCNDTAGGTLSTALPAPSTGGIEFTGPEYTTVSDEGANYTIKSCTPGGAVYRTAINTIVWDLTGKDLSTYTQMVIMFKGLAGMKASCTGGYSAAGSNTNLMRFQIWNATGGAWQDVGPIGTTYNLTGQQFTSNLAQYRDGSNKVWARIVSTEAYSPSECSQIETDYVRLAFFH